MSCTLGDHVSKRRFEIFNLIHHHVLYFAYGVILHISERCVEKSVCQTETKSLKNIVCHIVGDACG